MSDHLKKSLGIWALGPMVTRFVPGGYKPELAVELRRANYGANGERLGLDLYPYTEDQVAAVRRSVLQWNFIDEVASRIDDAALRDAQSRKDAVAAYELVYGALGAKA